MNFDEAVIVWFDWAACDDCVWCDFPAADDVVGLTLSTKVELDSLANLVKYAFISSSVCKHLSSAAVSDPPVRSKIWSLNDFDATS